jgi:hypothetical protein
LRKNDPFFHVFLPPYAPPPPQKFIPPTKNHKKS